MAVGNDNFFSSTSNEFFFTGVQLELGTEATPFEYRSYGDELARCQRYYQQYDSAENASSGAGFTGVGFNSTLAIMTGTFLTEMRAAPAATLTNIVLNHGGGTSAVTSSSNFSSKRTFGGDLTCSGGGLSADGCNVMQFNAGGGASPDNKIVFDAEL